MEYIVVMSQTVSTISFPGQEIVWHMNVWTKLLPLIEREPDAVSEKFYSDSRIHNIWQLCQQSNSVQWHCATADQNPTDQNPVDRFQRVSESRLTASDVLNSSKGSEQQSSCLKRNKSSEVVEVVTMHMYEHEVVAFGTKDQKEKISEITRLISLPRTCSCSYLRSGV